MAMPFDIREIVRSATQMRAEREQPVRIAVLVEVDAPDPLVDVLRDRLRPRTAAARLQIEAVEPGAPELVVDPTVDAAIAVIGRASADMVKLLAGLVRAGVQTVALVQGPVPEELALVLGMSRDNVVGDPEPVRAVDDRLAEWLADRLAKKRLALANNFPFTRRHAANHLVNSTAMQNAVIGAVAIIPGADMPLMTANQAKMLLQIAASYGEDLGTERAKELLAIVGGGFTLRAVARQVLDFIPGFGWAIKGGIGYTGTIAMGKATIAYFEQGADLGQVAHRLRDATGDVTGAAAGRVRRLRGRGEPEPSAGGDADGA